MTVTSAPLPKWSALALRNYRDKVAPFRKNGWNDLDEWLKKKHRGTVIFLVAILCILYAVFVAPPTSLQSPAEWISVAALFVGLSIYLVIILIPTLGTPKPRWIMLPLAEYYERYGLGHSPNHPLRQAIVEARRRYPEAEFRAECFLPEMEKKDPPKNVFVWMYPDPSNKTDRFSLMVLENGRPIDPLTWS